MPDCLFCSIDPERIIATSPLFYAIADGFPVTEGHILVISKRHVEDWFGLTNEELLDCNQLLCELHEELRLNDRTIRGFNIGTNAGAVAGQTIPHCHVHLIPRRQGDMTDPRGGVRGVIPAKQKY